MPRTTDQPKHQLFREQFELFEKGGKTVQQFCRTLGCTPEGAIRFCDAETVVFC